MSSTDAPTRLAAASSLNTRPSTAPDAQDALHLGRDEVEPARDQGAEVVGHDLGDRGVRLELELTEHLTEAQRIAGADLLELTEGAVELVAPRRRRGRVDQRRELVAVHAAQLDLDVGS